MAVYTSAGTTVVVAKQTGTEERIAFPSTGFNPIPATDESMSFEWEKIEPESMLAEQFRVLSIPATCSASGSVSSPITDDFIDWALECALGTKTAVTEAEMPFGGEDETFSGNKYTCSEINTQLPYSAMAINRGNEEIAFYPGLVINNLGISATAGDIAEASIDLAGADEIIGLNKASHVKPSVSSPATATDTTWKKSASGEVPYIANESTFKVGETMYCAESFELSLDNAGEEVPRCFQDGKGPGLMIYGMRNYTVSIQMPWDGSNALYHQLNEIRREGKMTTVACSFDLKKGNKHIYIDLPACFVDEDSYNASGASLIDGSISLSVAGAKWTNGVKAANATPITIYVVEKDA